MRAVRLARRAQWDLQGRTRSGPMLPGPTHDQGLLQGRIAGLILLQGNRGHRGVLEMALPAAVRTARRSTMMQAAAGVHQGRRHLIIEVVTVVVVECIRRWASCLDHTPTE